jgi:hypothetical protein
MLDEQVAFDVVDRFLVSMRRVVGAIPWAYAEGCAHGTLWGGLPRDEVLRRVAKKAEVGEYAADDHLSRIKADVAVMQITDQLRTLADYALGHAEQIEKEHKVLRVNLWCPRDR